MIKVILEIIKTICIGGLAGVLLMIPTYWIGYAVEKRIFDSAPSPGHCLVTGFFSGGFIVIGLISLWILGMAVLELTE